MKRPANNKDLKIDQIIDILSFAESEIEKEVQSEEAIDSHDVEEKAWETGAQQLREKEFLKLLRLNNIDFTDNILFRRKLTFILLWVIIVWLLFIAFIIVMQGLHGTICPWPLNKYIFGFHLESNIVIAILCTTTVTVLGLFYVVTSHIFYRGKQDTKKDD